MYRIDNETAVNIMPAPAADGPNPDSFFTHGSAEDGIPATIVEQDWANAVQEELCYVIEQAGLTLSKSTHTQLLQAIKLISQGNTSSYTTSTTAANTYTATLSPAPAAYTTGMLAYIKFTNANTGAATINLNGLGAKDINRVDGSALNAGDIAATMIAILMYDGTNFQLLNAPTSPVALQNSLYVYADDTGSANAYAVTLAPAITSYVKGLRLISKIANTNTAASTLNVNALGTKAIQRPNGDALVGNELVTGQMAEFVYDGTQFRLVNPANDATQPKIQNNSYSYAADSGSANTYAVALTPAITSYVTGLIVRTTIANGNSGASTLNVNSLGTKNILLLNGDALVGGELITGMIAQLFYDGTQFRLLNPSTVNGRLLNVQVFTTSGTYTPTLGTKKAFVECWGGGGGGGGNTNGSFAGGGGGGGAYSADLISISGTATITVGAGGAGAAASSTNTGTTGGDTSFNASVIAKGGIGGAGASGAAAGGVGGAAGSCTGKVKISGGDGWPSTAVNTALFGGMGGMSPRLSWTPNTNVGGNGASNSGQGGHGGSTGAGGGTGGSGYVVVSEFA